MSPGLQRADGPPVILASASAARAAILAAAGVPVALQPAVVDEAELKASFREAGATATDAAIALAELKANRVSQLAPDAAIVLGADQVLATEDAWFDKPVDLAAARDQLERLGGGQHRLHTAVVAFRGRVRVWHHQEVASLWMRPLSPGFLDRYLEAVGNDVLATVGGYHIERLGCHLFSRIEGDHFTIQGLPLLPTLAFLRDQGVLVR